MLAISDLPFHPFTRTQAEVFGLSRKRLQRAVDARQVRRMLHGVYVRADARDSVGLRCQAAHLVISPHSVVRDRSAAWIHGIELLDYAETELLPPIETSVPRFKEPTRRRGHAGVTRDLAERDISYLHGLFVTTPLRTALDLGCSLSPRMALAALDAFAAQFGLTKEQLELEALRFAGRRGVVQLRMLLSLIDPKAESFPESWCRYELVNNGLPMPDSQVWVDVDGVPRYRLDLAYERHKVAIEYDGAEFHDAPESRARDEERRATLRALGWIVVVVRRDCFTPDAIESWTREVRAALNARRRWAL